jgi:N-acetylmuramoyl-L-alanine amidase
MRSSGSRHGVASACRRIISARRKIGCAMIAVLAATTLQGQTTDPGALYKQAVRREAVLRQELEATKPGSPAGLLLERIRTLVVSYEDMARLFPTSEYGDDSLSQGGLLAADAFARFGDHSDRATAVRLLKSLATRFPASALNRQALSRTKELEKGTSLTAATEPTTPGLRPKAPSLSEERSAGSSPPPPVATSSSTVTLRAIRREVLPETLRVTLELDREVTFHDERIEGPPRVFIDLPNTRAAETLKDATIPFPDGVVRQVRVGRQLNQRTRVVLDLSGAGAHSVYAVYNPFRVVIDFRAPAGAPAVLTARPAIILNAAARAPAVIASSASRGDRPGEPPSRPAPVPAPASPPRNTNGSFSLARQLGLGVTRIVIDPGHGGHDPGARGNGISEAALVLDVAVRLEELLKKQSVEVLLTRRTNAYVSLEERTALANRNAADLFLSIHANASTVPAARGIETYFLNFATNSEAEAIAARENAGSARSMRHLPDIVQAIAMNNKIDESRDFATIVQSTLYEQLRKTNRTLKNLGVKQAPFMVLVGATMPSVLAEISFMSNSAEATLLKTDRYKQQIADALLAGIMRYQGSLKKVSPKTE